MRILVTSSRNTFALDLIRKLGSAGHTVVASDTYEGAIGNHSKYLKAHAVTASPRFETNQFIDDVNQIVREHDIELILPAFEEAFFLSARRHDLPESVTLFTGEFEQLARLHDKVSFQRIAALAGVPAPETIVATDDASLRAATEKYPEWFARAAFSRGGVGLLTNTGPLAGKVAIEDCHPTTEQPWLVQPFIDGPMICTYSVVVNGVVTGHSTYRAPEQWAHSTGIGFETIDSTETLKYTQQIVDQLGGNYSGQLSFDFVDHHGELYAIECNPRPTSGVIMMDTDGLTRALTGALSGESTEPYVVPAGEHSQISLAVLADAFTEPLKHLPKTLHDLIHVRDIGHGWHDSIAMMWAPATLVHGAKMSKGEHEAILKALGEDIVWNGEEIEGMRTADAAALEAVHAQRV